MYFNGIISSYTNPDVKILLDSLSSYKLEMD